MSSRDAKRLANRVDLNLLELFESVYRSRHLTAAGGELGLSQPAMSRSLARLREAYGDKLFVRSPQGLMPTPFADHLYESASAVLEIVRRTLEPTAFDPGTAARTFRLAMSDTAEQVFLPRLAGALAAAAPGVRLEAQQLPTPQLARALAMGQVDLALGFFLFDSDDFLRQRLFAARYACVARRDHPDISERLTLALYRSLGHVVTSFDNTAHADAIDAILRSPAVKANIAMKVGHFLSIGPIVAETGYIATIPRNLALSFERAWRVRMYEPPLKLPGYEVSQNWHVRFDQEPGLAWLRAEIQALFGRD